MTVSTDLIHLILEDSMTEFLGREADALTAGISERSSCSRLALYMERIAHERGLHDYYTDTEYNRKQGGQVKTILDEEMRVIVINADLILHSRGKYVVDDNLIAVEMKKSARPAKEKASDRSRLRAMTKKSYDGVWSNDGKTHPEHVCGYRLGVYVEVNTRAREVRIEYFSDGNCTGVTSRQY